MRRKKIRADKILDKLQQNEEIEVDKSKRDKENVNFHTRHDNINGTPGKRKKISDHLESETSPPTSPSIIQSTPQKSVIYRNYNMQLRNGTRNLSKPEAISIPRKCLKFDDTEPQKDNKVNSQEKHSMPLPLNTVLENNMEIQQDYIMKEVEVPLPVESESEKQVANCTESQAVQVQVKEAVSIPRKCLKFDDNKPQKDDKVNPQEKHREPLNNVLENNMEIQQDCIMKEVEVPLPVESESEKQVANCTESQALQVQVKEAVSIPRKCLKFDDNKPQKDDKVNPQEKHREPLNNVLENDMEIQQNYIRKDDEVILSVESEGQVANFTESQAVQVESFNNGRSNSSPCPGAFTLCHENNKRDPMLEEPSTSRDFDRTATRSLVDYRISPVNTDKSDTNLSDSDPTFRSQPRSRLGTVLLEEPSTSRATRALVDYRISPVNTDESDVDLSDADPTFRSRPRSRLSAACKRSASSGSGSSSSSSSGSSSSSSSSSTSSDPVAPASVATPETTPLVAPAAAADSAATKRSRKRQRNPQTWKQNVAKSLRNTGKEYVSHTKSQKVVPARSVKDPCTDKCRLKCATNINESDRITIFNSYWGLGDVELQRSFIRNAMVEIKPKYKYTNAERPRNPNSAFYFTVNNNKIRVCKTFFLNTLDICDKVIRTVKSKTDAQGFVERDLRGKVEVNRKRVDPTLVQDIKKHINSIPRIESHYLRCSTTREYIGGEKTIKDLWRDFDKDQREAGKRSCLYWLYYEIFNKDFNIGFFQPKKDRCDLCVEYELAPPERKPELKEKYDRHLQEKQWPRSEKLSDRRNIDETHVVAVFDLQAVMQCPSGEISSFYYRSKLNCLNLTIAELSKKTDAAPNESTDNNEHPDTGAYSNVYCYFWDETQGQRGANEIGSCLLNYLEVLNAKHEGKALQVIFYSDNCCGQNKNKYIASIYSYAVYKFENIHSITHKYLIKGHTQNEGDNVHSLIEKEIQRHKKSGPVYAPSQYVMLIKHSRKTGHPFIVNELSFDSFLDLKAFQEEWAYNFTEDDNKQNLKWNDIKALKFTKQDLLIFHYKTSFSQTDFTKVDMRNKRRKKMLDVQNINMNKAYSKSIELSKRKQDDLRYLVENNLIPYYHAYFYKSFITMTQ